MEAGDLAGALAVGLVGGLASGMLGVGGGVLFVPGLVFFLHQDQLSAEATSLVAVVFVAVFGAWRQREYGNLNMRDGIVIGVLSPLGVVGGTVLANVMPERALELMFAAVQLVFAYGLAQRVIANEQGGEGASEA